MQVKVFEQHYPKPKSWSRFRIIETIMTIDGPIDVITNRSFPTIEQALDYIDSRGVQTDHDLNLQES